MPKWVALHAILGVGRMWDLGEARENISHYLPISLLFTNKPSLTCASFLVGTSLRRERRGALGRQGRDSIWQKSPATGQRTSASDPIWHTSCIPFCPPLPPHCPFTSLLAPLLPLPTGHLWPVLCDPKAHCYAHFQAAFYDSWKVHAIIWMLVLAPYHISRIGWLNLNLLVLCITGSSSHCLGMLCKDIASQRWVGMRATKTSWSIFLPRVAGDKWWGLYWRQKRRATG